MALGLPINDKHSASSSEEIVDLQTYTDLINSERPGLGTAPASNRSPSPLHQFACLRLCGRRFGCEANFFLRSLGASLPATHQKRKNPPKRPTGCRGGI